jgi:colanic acid/amylovoran biosynthesis glycosyltransferase
VKLIYVTVTMPYGPTEAFFIPEAKALLAAGCELLIVPRSPSRGVANRDAESLEAKSLPKPLLSGEILAAAMAEIARHPRRCLRVLGWLFRSRNIKTFLKNLLVFPKGLWLGRIARKWGADHIHAHWATATATMAMVASEVSEIPWSFTAHRGDIVQNNLLRTKPKRAAFVRFISDSGLRLFESITATKAASNACVIHMGAQFPERIDASKPLPPMLFCPANLLPVKGHIHLLRAMAVLKARGQRCKLEIAGDGPSQPHLQREAIALGIDDRVMFLGRIPHDAILSRYANRQVGFVVLPSVDLGGGLHEGIPVALVEAMAYGIPVISTPTGGMTELFRDGAGILVPAADPAALADSIERLIRDPSLQARMSAAGRQRIAEEFAVDQIAKTLMSRFAAASPGPRRRSNEAKARLDRRTA